jgi:integrase
MPNAETLYALQTRSGHGSLMQAACTSKSAQPDQSGWFWKTYFDGKEGRMALGSYPTVALTAARKARDAAKLQKSEGTDPVQARKLEKVKNTRNVGDTFKAIALEWYGKQAPQWSPSHAGRMLRQLERDLFPWIGERPIVQIHAMELLAALQKIEERGALETADRALMLARQVWDYWLPTADAQQRNITEGLKARLLPYRGKNFAAILDPQRMGQLMRAIKAYRGGPIVRTALQLTPLLYQRPGNLRMMEWSELDLDRALWTIPSMKMKRTVQGKEQGEAHLYRYLRASRDAVAWPSTNDWPGSLCVSRRAQPRPTAVGQLNSQCLVLTWLRQRTNLARLQGQRTHDAG